MIGSGESEQKKYGLIKMNAKPKPPPKEVKLKPAGVFGIDDDEDTSSFVDAKKAMVQKSFAASAAKVDAFAASAMKEDPSIFDYDGAYESMQAVKSEETTKKSAASRLEAPKSRYIGNLLSASQMREKEQERIFEKLLLKERQAEDAEFGEQPKYLTAAYKKKLLEDKKWEYEGKMTEEVEKKHDVRTLGMQGFYSSMLTKNVAMGGDVKVNALSAYTAGSDRQEHFLAADEPGAISATVNSSHHHQPQKQKLSSSSPPSQQYQAPVQPSTSQPSHIRDEEVRDEEKLPAAAAATTAAIVPKEEIVQSARERYLARKRSLESMQES